MVTNLGFSYDSIYRGQLTVNSKSSSGTGKGARLKSAFLE